MKSPKILSCKNVPLYGNLRSVPANTCSGQKDNVVEWSLTPKVHSFTFNSYLLCAYIRMYIIYIYTCLHAYSVFCLQVWDSMGSVKYRAMAYTFYSAADACILVFDLTKPSSFESLEKWRTTFLQETGSDTFPFVVMGNKTDLVEKAEKRVRVLRVYEDGESLPVTLRLS